MEAILRLVEALARDLRYAVRALRRDTALATFAILMIGVGVGASATVFSVVNGLWLRPLPFDAPGRLVWVANGSSENLSRQAVQVGHVVDLREQSQSLTGLAGFSPFYGVGDIRLTGAGEAERAPACPSQKASFRCWVYVPGSDETLPTKSAGGGAPRTAILSYAFWQRRLGAKADAIGASIPDSTLKHETSERLPS
jgi:MacB-like periplasmic core domain